MSYLLVVGEVVYGTSAIVAAGTGVAVTLSSRFRRVIVAE